MTWRLGSLSPAALSVAGDLYSKSVGVKQRVTVDRLAVTLHVELSQYHMQPEQVALSGPMVSDVLVERTMNSFVVGQHSDQSLRISIALCLIEPARSFQEEVTTI